MITTPHTRPFKYPIIQEYAALGLDPTKIEFLSLFDQGAELYDASGNQRHGTITGATWTGKGRYGSALDFDGVDDNVALANSSGVNFGDGTTDSAFSISAYININSTISADGVIVSKFGAAGTREWAFNIDYDAGGNHRIELLMKDDDKAGLTAITSSMGLSLGKFYHAVFTYDLSLGSGATAANGMNLYINSVLDSAPTRSNNADHVAMEALGADIIISENAAGANDLDGIIDNVLLYSDALNISQISNMYNAGL